MVVILWGVAAASLLLSPAQADLEVEAELPSTTEPFSADVENDPDKSANSSVTLDQFAKSDAIRQKDVDPQSDLAFHNDEVLNNEDQEEGAEYEDEEGELEADAVERGIGNIRDERNGGREKNDANARNRKQQIHEGRKNKDNSQNPKGLRIRKVVDSGAKRRQGQRRRPNDGRLMTRKTKTGQVQIRKRNILKQGVAKAEVPKEEEGNALEKNGEPSLRNKSKKRKREIWFYDKSDHCVNLFPSGKHVAFEAP